MSGALDMATVTAALAKLPPPPRWKGFVVRPDVALALRCKSAAVPPSGILGTMGGLPFHEKQGQAAACWAFEDEKVMRQYLAGEITEIFLVTLTLVARIAAPENPAEPQRRRE